MENLNNNTGPTKQEKKNKDKMVLWIIIGALVCVNAVLVFNLMQKGDQLQTTGIDLIETEEELAQLDTLYQKGEKMIKILTRDTTQLNDELREKIQVIRLQNEEIEKIKKQASYDKAALRAKIKKFEAQIEELFAKIDELEKDNEYLRQSNTELLGIRKKQEQELSEKQETIKKQTQLLDIAKRLDAKSFKVVGINERRGGKERETERNTAVDKLKIEFELAPNEVADSGPKNIFVKINSPTGSTLAVEGSGTFTVDGQESMYTVNATVDYNNNEPKKVVLYWTMNNEFPEGDYHCELYQEGYLISETEFSLR